MPQSHGLVPFNDIKPGNALEPLGNETDQATWLYLMSQNNYQVYMIYDYRGNTWKGYCKTVLSVRDDLVMQKQGIMSNLTYNQTR